LLERKLLDVSERSKPVKRGKRRSGGRCLKEILYLSYLSWARLSKSPFIGNRFISTKDLALHLLHLLSITAFTLDQRLYGSFPLSLFFSLIIFFFRNFFDRDIFTTRINYLLLCLSWTIMCLLASTDHRDNSLKRAH